MIYLAKLVCNSTLVSFKEMKHHKEAACTKYCEDMLCGQNFSGYNPKH
jgi:hypothetical protein